MKWAKTPEERDRQRQTDWQRQIKTVLQKDGTKLGKEKERETRFFTRVQGK